MTFEEDADAAGGRPALRAGPGLSLKPCCCCVSWRCWPGSASAARSLPTFHPRRALFGAGVAAVRWALIVALVFFRAADRRAGFCDRWPERTRAPRSAGALHKAFDRACQRRIGRQAGGQVAEPASGSIRSRGVPAWRRRRTVFRHRHLHLDVAQDHPGAGRSRPAGWHRLAQLDGQAGAVDVDDEIPPFRLAPCRRRPCSRAAAPRAAAAGASGGGVGLQAGEASRAAEEVVDRAGGGHRGLESGKRPIVG